MKQNSITQLLNFLCISVIKGMTPSDGSYVGPSSCNEYTDRLGAGQRVLSYSYYTPGSIILVLLCLLFAGLDSF